jgi:hypothetical protein
MARIKAEVDKAKLQAAINKAEANGPLANRLALWKAAIAIYNADGVPVQINTTVAYLRFVEMGLTCVTPVGKKGRQGPMTDELKAKMKEARAAAPRLSRATKMAAIPDAQKHFDAMAAVTPSQYKGLLERVKKGSLTAAIKLMCVQCMGFEKKHVWDCRGFTCPMYLHRPYRKADEADKDAGEAEVVLEDHHDAQEN